MIDLYGYQEEMVDASFDKPGFINGDDMGLGKTYETIGEIAQWTQHYGIPRPSVLITGPKTALDVWERSIPNILPDAEISYDVYNYRSGFLLINYEAMFMRKRKDDPTYRRLDIHKPLAKIVWDFHIADEAHRIKNRKAKQARAVKKVRSMHKRALTGTPIINRPDELWSILNWLNKSKWSSYWRFFEEYIDYEIVYPYGFKKIIGPKNTDKLQAELADIFLRRTKEEVLHDLPEKYYSYVRLDMTPKQTKAYNEMKKDSIAWLDQLPEEVPLEAPTVLAKLTRLRQFAGSYCQIQATDYDPIREPDKAILTHVTMEEPSNKIDALVEILEDATSPVVVFSQFTQLIGLASERLNRIGMDHAVLTGQTPMSKRGGIIEKFSRGDTPVILMNLQTGGVGIDGLQDASQTVVFLDRSWSPAYNSQAEDRLHRNGQKNAVQVIILQSKGTVDLVIEERLERKKSWVRQCLGN